MLVLALLVGALLNSCHGLDNGLALTPPMGWMSWWHDECIRTIDCKKYPDKCISANLIKRTADRLVSDGYLDAGYEYLVIDECWMESTRAPDGHLVADRERFPLGMKDVADYVHSKGLKFGLRYSNDTCISYPKFMDIEKLTVATIKEWDLDYVKLGACLGSSWQNLDEGYKAYGTLLNDTGRDILYSCSWPGEQETKKILPNYNVVAVTCNTWRNWYKVGDDWHDLIPKLDWYGDNGARLAKHAGPGHWNDPDTLIIGKSGMSEDQSKVQMAVWAILAAPLLMETDLGTIKPEYKRILLNRDIIDVNQDVLGKQGLRILQRSQIDVWRRELHDGSVAIAFINRRESGVPYRVNFTHADLQLPEQTYDVMDLYHEDELGVLCETCKFVTQVKSTGVKFYKFTKRTLNKLEDTMESSLKDMGSLMKEMRALIPNNPSYCTKQETRINKLETTMDSLLQSMGSLKKEMRNLIPNNLSTCTKQETRINKLETTVESSLKNIGSLMEEMKTLISNISDISSKQESRINNLETAVESSFKTMALIPTNTLVLNSRINTLENIVESSRNDFKHQNEVMLQKIEHVHDNVLKLTSMLTSS